jgi:hypothetical protein
MPPNRCVTLLLSAQRYVPEPYGYFRRRALASPKHVLCGSLGNPVVGGNNMYSHILVIPVTVQWTKPVHISGML